MSNLSERQFGEYTLRHITADMGERKERQIIEAHQGAIKVGELNWYGTTGTIHNLDVEEEHSRKGIATAMWKMGQEIKPTTMRPKHSADRTDAGEAWSKAVGGSRPRRSRQSSPRVYRGR